MDYFKKLLESARPEMVYNSSVNLLPINIIRRFNLNYDSWNTAIDSYLEDGIYEDYTNFYSSLLIEDFIYSKMKQNGNSIIFHFPNRILYTLSNKNTTLPYKIHTKTVNHKFNSNYKLSYEETAEIKLLDEVDVDFAYTDDRNVLHLESYFVNDTSYYNLVSQSYKEVLSGYRKYTNLAEVYKIVKKL